MIEERGNIFDATCDALCITTNGFVKNDGTAVMGRGVALQATQLYPRIKRVLGNSLKAHGNHVTVLAQEGSRALVALPVKHAWWEDADTRLIRRSCHELVNLTTKRGWKRVVLPRPGCGNGHLDWGEVRGILAPILNDTFVVMQE